MYLIVADVLEYVSAESSLCEVIFDSLGVAGSLELLKVS